MRNQTLCLKLLWRLFSSDSLWAKWMRNNKIKDDVFWLIDEKKQCSWTWKALLHLRPLAIRFLKSEVGNGKLVSFWFDRWTPFGQLIQFLGPSGPSLTGIPLRSIVASASSPEGWILRPARSPQAKLLHIHLTTIVSPSLSSYQDIFFWSSNDDESVSFSIKKTWEALRERHDPQRWTEHIWYKGAIPRLYPEIREHLFLNCEFSEEI
ncbi:PREDICTED: uncharacterized protein LOC104753783 [Camelina sativa]|uniref:Uncharacterized protein LOC104753783 n=1 Tax=Camelina sativa TaxID=90675 RepID=A0ABM0WPN6_CAMSA|nr:PREDICTED: uncharacterized protein LOC104753783 [Camelina sativa]